jgi:hypothetical protein
MRVLDAEDPSAYHFDVMAEGQLGTRVPIAAKNDRGGIEGAPGNIYGTIFMGKRLTAGADGEGWDALGDLPPPSPISVPPRTNGDAPAEPATETELDIQSILDKEAAAVAAQAQETHSSNTAQPIGHVHQKEMPRPAPTPAPYVGPLVPQAVQVALETPPAEDKIPVTFKGDFGRFRGNYLYVHEDGNMLILIYDLEDPVYSPPKGNTEMSITCGEHTHKVYFLGVEFDLPFFDCGIQVFFKVD